MHTLNFTIGMYVKEKYYMQREKKNRDGVWYFPVSGIHWGSGNTPPSIKEDYYILA